MSVSDSKRKSPRAPLHLAILIDSDGVTSRGIAVNVGLGGMFIEGPSPGYGQFVDIIAQLPGMNAPARLPSVVRWSNAQGYGVQFLQLGAQVTHALSQLFARPAA